jgi:hypothetical protein
MDTENTQHGRMERREIGEEVEGEGETKKLTILVIFMSTIVLVMYGIIPFI